MSKAIIYYIYFVLCVQINAHSHAHHTSHISNRNNNNEESYNVKPKYQIVGNNNITENPTFKNFVNKYIKKNEYYNIIINYYYTYIVLESIDYYAECLVFNLQDSENITTINIENIVNYNDPIMYTNYTNNISNNITSNIVSYCIRYQHEYSNNVSILMLIFMIIITFCILSGCCGCFDDSYRGHNLY